MNYILFNRIIMNHLFIYTFSNFVKFEMKWQKLHTVLSIKYFKRISSF